MKRILYMSLTAVSLAAAGYFMVYARDGDDPDKPEYNLVKVQRKDLSQSVVATGTIKPKVGAEVKVGAQVSGIVKDLFVKVGSRVTSGQLLAIIDPASYRAKAAESLALKESAAAEKKYAETDLKRQKYLFGQNVSSQQQMDAASEKYELLSAKLKQAEANYDFDLLQLDYTKICSPIDGIVASISTQKGETVAAGFTAPTFMTVIDLDRLELWAYVDETDIGRIAASQKVTFTVDTYPGDSFDGVVETIYPDAFIQNNVVNYITVIRVQKHEGRILRPEMTATVQILTQFKKDVLALPKIAVQAERGRMFVDIPDNGKTEKRFITTGISDEKYYEVLSGLTEKDKVIVK